MRRIGGVLFLFIVLVIVTSSCGLQKRVYRKGFYFERAGNAPKQELIASSKGKFILEKPVASDPCDTIFFLDGTVVKGQVVELTSKECKYKLCDRSTGPLYVVTKAELASISYADGRVEVYKKQASGPCVTIVRKSGKEIRAVIEGKVGSTIFYRYCDGGSTQSLDTLFVKQIIYPEGYVKPDQAIEGGGWGDTCLTMIRKNGTQMQVKIKSLQNGVYYYTYCREGSHVMTLNSMFVSGLYLNGRPIEPGKIVSKPAEKMIDSCVTIVRKNGTLIRARLQHIDADNIVYNYCEGADRSVKTLECLYVEKVVTDGGVDLLRKNQEKGPAREISSWAIVSLVCGIAGAFGITAIAAIITGIIALRKIKREPNKYKGEGMAAVGIVLGSLALILFILVLSLLSTLI